MRQLKKDRADARDAAAQATASLEAQLATLRDRLAAADTRARDAERRAQSADERLRDADERLRDAEDRAAEAAAAARRPSAAATGDAKTQAELARLGGMEASLLEREKSLEAKAGNLEKWIRAVQEREAAAAERERVLERQSTQQTVEVKERWVAHAAEVSALHTAHASEVGAMQTAHVAEVQDMHGQLQMLLAAEKKWLEWANQVREREQFVGEEVGRFRKAEKEKRRAVERKAVEDRQQFQKWAESLQAEQQQFERQLTATIANQQTAASQGASGREPSEDTELVVEAAKRLYDKATRIQAQLDHSLAHPPAASAPATTTTTHHQTSYVTPLHHIGGGAGHVSVVYPDPLAHYPLPPHPAPLHPGVPPPPPPPHAPEYYAGEAPASVPAAAPAPAVVDPIEGPVAAPSASSGGDYAVATPDITGFESVGYSDRGSAGCGLPPVCHTSCSCFLLIKYIYQATHLLTIAPLPAQVPEIPCSLPSSSEGPAAPGSAHTASSSAGGYSAPRWSQHSASHRAAPSASSSSSGGGSSAVGQTLSAPPQQPPPPPPSSAARSGTGSSGRSAEQPQPHTQPHDAWAAASATQPQLPRAPSTQEASAVAEADESLLEVVAQQELSPVPPQQQQAQHTQAQPFTSFSELRDFLEGHVDGSDVASPPPRLPVEPAPPAAAAAAAPAAAAASAAAAALPAAPPSPSAATTAPAADSSWFNTSLELGHARYPKAKPEGTAAAPAAPAADKPSRTRGGGVRGPASAQERQATYHQINTSMTELEVRLLARGAESGGGRGGSGGGGPSAKAAKKVTTPRAVARTHSAALGCTTCASPGPPTAHVYLGGRVASRDLGHANGPCGGSGSGGGKSPRTPRGSQQQQQQRPRKTRSMSEGAQAPLTQQTKAGPPVTPFSPAPTCVLSCSSLGAGAGAGGGVRDASASSATTPRATASARAAPLPSAAATPPQPTRAHNLADIVAMSINRVFGTTATPPRLL